MNVALYLHIDAIPLPCQDDALVERVRCLAPDISWIACGSEGEFIAALPGCEAAVVWIFKPEWAAAGKLRLLATPSAGGEWVRLEPRSGLEIMRGSFHGELMAETVVGMMLAFARGIKAALDAQGSHPWPRAEITAIMQPLRGSRALILGFGHIGKWIGRLLKPFGVAVTGVNRCDLSRPDYFDAGDVVEPAANLDRLLPEADHLILALPGGTGTDMLVDSRRLRLLPAGAFVYNVGRGNSLDAVALAAELHSGRLGGAGLDVYDPEPPPPDSPLRDCQNVILMPHVSAMSPNYLDLFFAEFIPRVRALKPR